MPLFPTIKTNLKTESFFKLAELIAEGIPSVRWFFSLMRKAEAQTFLYQETSTNNINTNEELAELNSFYKNLACVKVYELIFLGDQYERIDDVPNNVPAIAYIKIRKYFNSNNILLKTYVSEAIVTPPQDANLFIHCRNIYNVGLYDKIFEIDGSYYAQQDAITGVCAHACLKMFAKIIHPDFNISNMLINEILDIDVFKLRITNGLNILQCEYVLSKLGFNVKSIQKDFTVAVDLIYGAIESGQPVIIAFKIPGQTHGHVIIAVGHTFKEYDWRAFAETHYFKVSGSQGYIKNRVWLDNFVIHNDNSGMYQLLSTEYLKDVLVDLVIGLPDEIPPYYSFVYPKDIEYMCFLILSKLLNVLPSRHLNYLDGIDWFRRLVYFYNNNDIVLRTFNISKDKLFRHLESLEDKRGTKIRENQINEIKSILDNVSNSRVWLCEISLPYLYPINNAKIGEIVIKSDIIHPPRDLEEILNEHLCFVRLPNVLIIPQGDGTYRFGETGIKEHTNIYLT